MADDMAGMGSPGLKERMRTGEVVVGTFIQTPHPVVCEFLVGMGFDMLCLEAEHSAMGPETVQSLVAACDRSGAESLVRIANNDWVLIAGALDAGAAGIICPRVNTAAEAKAFVKASLYPPSGDRGIGPGRITAYGYNAGPDYRARANARNLIAAQVETKAAVRNLEGILGVEGLDMVFIGPADLTSSLGLAGMDDPKLKTTIEKILATAQAAGKLTGIFAGNPAGAAHWISKGANLVLLASDLMFMGNGGTDAKAQLAKLREG